MKLSKNSENLMGQQMFQILDAANKLKSKGKKIYHFEIGDPKYNTPKKVVDTCIKSLRSGVTHYSGSGGLIEFKKAAIKRFKFSRKFEPDLDQILVTQGANVQIFYSLYCIADPGDEIIIGDPSFVSYLSIIKMLNLKPVFYNLNESNDFKVNTRELKKKISKRTKAIIINSPNNPTGSLLSKENITDIFNIAKKNNIFLISDEVYGRLVYEKSRFFSPSVLDKCKSTTIVIHSLSKSYAMTGWRIGAVTGPSKLIKKMQLVLETTTSCVSPFIQIAAIKALNSSQIEIKNIVEDLRYKRDFIYSQISRIHNIDCLKPKGAFYIFVNIKKITKDDVKFSKKLLNKRGVATCPGSFFGKNGQGYLRFSFATSSNTIKLGIAELKKFILNKEYL